MNARLSLLALLACSLLLTSCEGAALQDAQRKNSPEALETFLERYPDSAEADSLRAKIEELRYEAARDSRSAEQLREYLAKHPDGPHAGKARELEDEVSWQIADGTKTADGYKSYIDLHPTGKWLDEATVAYGKYAYVAQLTVGEVSIERVNMAQDPQGPLNGWGITTEVTNTGDRRLRRVKMAIDYLGADGAAVRTDEWYAVAQDLGVMPVRPTMQGILEPGGVRPFRFTTAEEPAGWDVGKLAVRVTEVRFEE